MSERIFLSPGEKTAGHYLLVDPQTLGQLRILRVGDVELQLDGQRLMVRGIPVHLPRKEFIVLRQLMDNVGRVVTRCELLDNAWGPDRKDARNYLEVHIRRLRRKIEDDADRPTRIRTVRRVGYIFDLPPDERDEALRQRVEVPGPFDETGKAVHRVASSRRPSDHDGSPGAVSGSFSVAATAAEARREAEWRLYKERTGRSGPR